MFMMKFTLSIKALSGDHHQSLLGNVQIKLQNSHRV